MFLKFFFSNQVLKQKYKALHILKNEKQTLFNVSYNHIKSTLENKIIL